MAQNPWAVESIQDFYFLKCPECDFDTKIENSFETHATENHPLSLALFGKKNIVKDFDTVDIKEEPLSHLDMQNSYDDQKFSTNNQFSQLSPITEDNFMLVVPEVKREPTDKSYMNSTELSDLESGINNTQHSDIVAPSEIQEPKTKPVIPSAPNTDGFSKLAEEIRLKTENMKLKLEVSKLQREKNIEANKVTKVKKESEKQIVKQKVKEGEMLKALNEMTKSRDSARKANDNNRARVSNLKKKVKRLESEKYTKKLKKEGVKEMLEKTKFTPGQAKNIMNPDKKIHYSKQDVVQVII